MSLISDAERAMFGDPGDELDYCERCGGYRALAHRCDLQDAVDHVCNECGHDRRLHSREGCTDLGCVCKVRFMDRDKFRPK